MYVHSSEAGGALSATQALWSRFAGADELAPFCQAWLALQCASLDGAQAGVVIWRQADASFAPVAVWPNLQRDVTHLGAIAQKSLAERRGLAEPMAIADAAGPTGRYLLAYPLVVDERACGVAVVELRLVAEAQLQPAMQRLHWGAGWLDSRARVLAAREAGTEIARSRVVIDMLVLAGEAATAKEALLALANGLVDAVGAARVMAGIVRHGRAQVEALSRTAWFDRRSQDVAAIENLMEEAHDQGATVRWPVRDGAPFRVGVAHEEWSRKASGRSVCTVVVPGRDALVGAITVERDDGRPFGADDERTLEAVALVVGPLLEDKLTLDHWLAGRAPRALATLRDRLTRRGHATWKLGAGAAALAVLLMAVLTQDYRVTAKSVIEGIVQRAAVAPYDGFVAHANVRAGQQVQAGEVLAVLDDRDLRLEQSRWQGEFDQATQKHRDAMAKHDRAASAVLEAQMRQARAQLDLIEAKLARTQITAPIAGLVVSGDLSQKLGSPVQTGDTLFEIAPLDAYRVILQVDERDIGQLQIGQRGQLVLNGLSAQPMDFAVSSVTAVAEQREGVNHFRVEAALTQAAPALRPGMEGVGKVEVGERQVLWVWTHSLVEWVRLALWRWLP